MREGYFLKFKFAIAFSVFLIPAFVLAANDDPFRGGREAVNPKQSAGVGESTGAMTYSYPFMIPPGRNGVQPNLSLNYSSDDKRQDSIFGYGWSMSLPYIERVNKLGTNNFYNQDTTHTFFTSSLSGELLPVVNSTPIGGSFLGLSLGMSPFSLIQTEEVAPFSSTESAPSTSETASLFHTFTKTFSPIHVYHPNREADWNSAREQASREAKMPIRGFPVAPQKTENIAPKSGPTYFAEIDNNGIVLRVIVIDQASLNTGLWGDPKNWIETSMEGSINGRYAGKGYAYDRNAKVFIAPTPVAATSSNSTIPASFYVASSTPR